MNKKQNMFSQKKYFDVKIGKNSKNEGNRSFVGKCV